MLCLWMTRRIFQHSIDENMTYRSSGWCSSLVVKDKRYRITALLALVAAALYAIYILKVTTRSSTSANYGKFENSQSESQAGDRQPLFLNQEQSQRLSNLSIGLNEKLSATYVTSDTSAPLKVRKVFDLGWQGFNATCIDTVPSNDELQSSTSRPGSVEITYVSCCNAGSIGKPIVCRNASTPMIFPRRNAEEIYAAGERTINISAINVERDLVFITGASANHYRETLVLVRIIQNRFPGRKIIYWDIGLAADQVAEVRKFCNVVYKQLDFTKYPTHVRQLTTYAFKPLCIMETLKEYSLVWWVDSSTRFTSDNVTLGLSMLRPRHGLVMFDDPGHSVYSTTYPQTYKYIATDELGLQRTATCSGGSFIVANTPEIFSTFLYWLYACVLDERCIAPVGFPDYCKFKGPAVFAGCHRFDQSVMTILAANFWGFGGENYRFLHDFFKFERASDGRDDVRRCPAT